jgi:peptide/nickel transport system ATP-binding protein
LRPKVIVADEPVSMIDASLRATVLGNLLQLKRQFGISLIYITHDLTTAYQISDNIIILYRGSVAEAGSVERVVQDPRHPYTQLLISSIPVPDRKRRWVGEDLPEADAAPPRQSIGCKFAPRCKAVMNVCWQQAPPLYRTDPDRVAACFLYKDSPVLGSSDVAQVFGL